MKSQTFLMSFERLLRLLAEHNMRIDNSMRTPFSTPRNRRICMGQSVLTANDICEKFFGTWWEVELTAEDRCPLRCFYVADSLQDALRLRPGINTSYWCETDEQPRFLAEIAAWREDEYFYEE